MALLAPKHPYPLKDATYECGHEPVGTPRAPFRVQYYAIAIVFLIFDVETAFLYPWGLDVALARLGSVRRDGDLRRRAGRRARLRLAQGGAPVGVVDNAEQPGFITTTLDKLLRWGRSRSMWPVNAGIACCSLEMMTTGAARYDFDRFGIMFRSSPRQADVMIVPGPVTKKMAPIVMRVYNQMAEPRWVIAMGSCAISRRRPSPTPTTCSRASTRSCPWTCTSRAARRGPRRCFTDASS